MLRVITAGEANTNTRTIRSSGNDSLAQLWLQLALAMWIALGLAHAVKTLSDANTHSVFPIFHDRDKPGWKAARSTIIWMAQKTNSFIAQRSRWRSRPWVGCRCRWRR